MIAITRAILLFIRKKLPVREQTGDLVRREAQSRMNEFISVIGHELKTPLTSIKGNVQLMERRLKKDQGGGYVQQEEAANTLKEVRELLEKTERQLTRLAYLVNSLLENARIYENTIDLLFELCELDQLIRDVVGNPHYIEAERSIHLALPEGKAILIMGDANRIKQVIFHYVSNAHKYSKLEYPIEVTLREEGSMARVEVQDKGSGIPPGEQRRIWERFYRVKGIKVENGSEPGLGLGLHLSRTIITLHHGTVGVLSRPGEGATFWFTLPLLETTLTKIQ